MKKLLFICLITSSVFTSLNAQSTLIQSAEAYAQAIIDRDFSKAVSLTHLSIVSKGGGEEYIIKDFQRDRQSLVDQGIEYVAFEIGEAGQYLESEGELQTIVPVLFKMMMDKKDVESPTNLLAVSEDKGQSWRFVDLSKFDAQSLSDFIENISPDLQIPGY